MKKILIVEDQKEVREILEEFFRKEHGFNNITFATNGLEGYAEAYLQKFDLITSDYQMPFCNGGDMIFAIRKKAGINQHTPVIFVSAFIADFMEKVSSLEATYFVEKPIDFKRLSRYVKMAMLSQINKNFVNEV